MCRLACRMHRLRKTMEEAGDCMWEEMPDHLVERVMQRLPMDSCFRSRAVCKSWNHILSSHYFLAATKQQCLILCLPNTQMPCLLYSFTTHKWLTISLSFVKDLCGLHCRGSASGLLLLDLPSQNPTFYNEFPRTCVCNPVSRSCLWLPEMLSVKTVMAKGIAPQADATNYKVVVVGKSATDSTLVEVYNSCTKSWTISAVRLPGSLVINNGHMLFCNGFLYCMTLHSGILAYNVRDGTMALMSVPVTDVTASDNNKRMRAQLVTCENSVLVVAAVEEDHILQGVVFFEFQQRNGGHKMEWCWREIGRMPKSLCEEFRRRSWSNWFECVGVGEYMCFRGHGSMEVLAYSPSQCSWIWLPNCPPAYSYCKFMRFSSFALEAMPDTKP